MDKSFKKMKEGYLSFREKYAHGDQSVMQSLADNGQQPQIMVVACCDSRVDPALILQCDPGDLFVVRNVANIVPPNTKNEIHQGTSAALEFGICFLKVKHLILLGHSQCGGIEALLNQHPEKNDFISGWVSLIKPTHAKTHDANDYAKLALHQSYQNCLTFPWLQEKVNQHLLKIHLWYFDIKKGQILTYCEEKKDFEALDAPSC